MYTSLRKINADTKEKIINSYLNDEESIRSLKKKYNLFHGEVLAIIEQKNIREEDFPNGVIGSPCFIALADNHIGSIYEKEYYYEYLANILTENDVRDVVIAGDFLQGKIEPLDAKYQSAASQVNHAINLVPELKNVTWHILFGNHDISVLNNQERYLNVLRTRKDFHLLGFKRTYMKFGKYLFSISHRTPKYKIVIPPTDVVFSLHGHSHFESVKNRKVNLPPFCLDTKNGSIGSPYPGFVVIKRYNDEIVFFYYMFNEKVTKNTSAADLIKLKEEKIDAASMGKILTIKN